MFLQKHIPNILTIFRIILIPVFVVLFYLPPAWSNLVAGLVFIIAALTDLLDGYLARKWQVCSRFGAFLDPVADKIMVCTALVLMVSHYSKYENVYFPYISVFITICAAVVISREIVISALREWMAQIGKRTKVAVSWIGKWKTTLQMISITGLIWRLDPWNIMVDVSLVLLIIAVFLTIWSMIDYLVAGVHAVKENEAMENLEEKAQEARTEMVDADVENDKKDK